jgi:hypothetical protein
VNDLFDNIDWDDIGTFGDLVEEFEEEAVKYLRIEREFEKTNTEWQNENLDDVGIS